MTKLKPKAEQGKKPDAAHVLPSRARTRARESGGETLDCAEIAAASAAYQIRFRPTSRLAPYARNAQLHDPKQVAAIAASIEEFGFVGAVAADAKGILAGHGRTLAAEAIYKAGKRIKAPNGALIPDGTVPWIDCSGWTDAQRRAYIITDNQLTRAAGVDQELMRLEIADLADMEFDLNLLGFDAGQLEAMLNPDAGRAEDDGEGEALDEPEAPTVIACPKCQHQFSVLEERKDKPKRKAL